MAKKSFSMYWITVFAFYKENYRYKEIPVVDIYKFMDKYILYINFIHTFIHNIF